MEKRITWKGFFQIVRFRLVSPANNPGYWFYFILIIIGIGGIGVWRYSTPFDPNVFFESLKTYFIAILATSCVDISLKEFDNARAYKKSFQLAAYLILGIGLIMVFSGTTFLIVLSTILSWLMWWIANSDNDAILGEAPDLSKVSGDNKIIKGDFNGIKH